MDILLAFDQLIWQTNYKVSQRDHDESSLCRLSAVTRSPLSVLQTGATLFGFMIARSTDVIDATSARMNRERGGSPPFATSLLAGEILAARMSPDESIREKGTPGSLADGY